MQSLSATRKAQVETLLSEARRDHVQIVLWITPIRPEVAAFLASETSYVARLEETRIFAKKLGTDFSIPVFDFSNPAAFDATDSGWDDGAHIDEENSRRVADRVVTGLK
jgi:hypothetical protein